MRILIDLGHPAHVHLFRNAIQEWRERGHEVSLAARDKDIVTALLDQLGHEYCVASRARKGTAGLFLELLEHDWHVFALARKKRSQLLLGTSVSITHAAKLLRARSIVFSEDDPDVARAFARLAYPLADRIVTPRCVRGNYGPKHVVYDSYHELAYLHPNRFTPDPHVREELNLGEDEPFFIVRFVSFGAAHDVGEAGIEPATQRELLQLLAKYGRVFVSAEGPLPRSCESLRFPIGPERMHHALYFASLLVGESGTMAAEAAVLGTPAIRCTSLAGRCSILQELENEYGLTYAFSPNDGKRMQEKLLSILEDEANPMVWKRRRERLLEDKHDLTSWMVEFVEREGGRCRG